VESQVPPHGGVGRQGLQDGYRQPKKLLTEAMLDGAALKDLLGKNG